MSCQQLGCLFEILFRWILEVLCKTALFPLFFCAFNIDFQKKWLKPTTQLHDQTIPTRNFISTEFQFRIQYPSFRIIFLNPKSNTSCFQITRKSVGKRFEKYRNNQEIWNIELRITFQLSKYPNLTSTYSFSRLVYGVDWLFYGYFFSFLRLKPENVLNVLSWDVFYHAIN